MDRRPAAAERDDPVVRGRPLRPVEPRRDRHGTRHRRLARRGRTRVRVARRHSADDGAWHNYYLPDGTVEDAKLDTNVCAYVAAGVWHHWLCTWDRGFVDNLWPTVARDARLGAVDADAERYRAVGGTGRRAPWDYALLTGSSSICHAVECGAQLAALVGERASRVARAADRFAARHPQRPGRVRTEGSLGDGLVLPGAVRCRPRRGRQGAAGRRLGHVRRWTAVGMRCVSDEPWVTAAETAECSIACAAIGDMATAADLLGWTRSHRAEDGSYWTGIVYPDRRALPGRRAHGVHGRRRDPGRRRDHRRIGRQPGVRAPRHRRRLTASPTSGRAAASISASETRTSRRRRRAGRSCPSTSPGRGRRRNRRRPSRPRCPRSPHPCAGSRRRSSTRPMPAASASTSSRGSGASHRRSSTRHAPLSAASRAATRSERCSPFAHVTISRSRPSP